MDRQAEPTALPLTLAPPTDPKRQRGNASTSSLALRVGVSGLRAEHPLPIRQRLSDYAQALLLALLISSLSGCQIVIGVLQIAQGFPKTTCDFTKFTHGRKLTEKNKRVVVLCSSVDSARVEVPSLDIDIISEVSRQFKIASIKVVDEHKVATWIDDKGNITPETDLQPIGEHFKADFVVLFTFEDFGYREERSADLYRGHASGKVVVAEMIDDGIKPGKKRAKVIYNKPFNSKYPLNRPVSTDQEGPDLFKQKFMMQLSQTLTRLFVDYRPEDDI
jgi:hypothetical protein